MCSGFELDVAEFVSVWLCMVKSDGVRASLLRDPLWIDNKEVVHLRRRIYVELAEEDILRNPANQSVSQDQVMGQIRIAVECKRQDFARERRHIVNCKSIAVAVRQQRSSS